MGAANPRSPRVTDHVADPGKTPLLFRTASVHVGCPLARHIEHDISMKRTISDRTKVGGDGPPKKKARKGKEPAREAKERAQWPEYFESVCVNFLTIHGITLKPKYSSSR